MMSVTEISIAALAAALAAQPASAASDGSSDAAAAEANAQAPQSHPAQSEVIVVTGVRRSERDVLSGISVLDTAELVREVRPSLGETLARQTGVSATSFGPVASAPVIRGLSGDRVRVLVDGIGSLDLASSGPDHAIAINPLTADRIEVLRGPAALLFGSSAIGGVVNVIDSRISRRRPEGPVAANALVSYGSAANERSANASVNVGVAGGLVVHADGNWSRSDDLKTGGHILSRPLREEAAASPDPDIRALAELKGKLPNSSAKSWEASGGLAYVDGGLNAGVSVTRHRNIYGVPIRYSLEPGSEAEAPTISAEQTRFDARAEVPLSGAFSEVRARAGYARYHHDEIEEDGEIGSSFYSRGGEGRIELVQRERSGWGGTSGAQYVDRNARIRGEEKFLPDSRQRQAGLFTLQTYVAGPVRLEAGARLEFSRLTSKEDAQLGTNGHRRSFTTVSGSLGGQHAIGSGWRAGLALSRSARAPSVEELFAFGPHGGSQSFQVGNPDLAPETSLGVEASLHRDSGPLHFTGNVYFNRFSNFIFEAPTGEFEDDLPVFGFRQGRASFAGVEGQLQARLGEALGVRWGAEVQADAVRATVKKFGPAPFIPPVRIGGALTGERGPLDGRIEVEHAFAHRRTAPIETATPAYTLVNAALDWHPLKDRPLFTIALQANNIFDVVARRSTSRLKDYAPLAGRDIRLTARLGL